jgi:hypothetical protein
MFIIRILLNSELYKDQDTFISISKKITSLFVQELTNKYFEYRITIITIEIE